VHESLLQNGGFAAVGAALLKAGVTVKCDAESLSVLSKTEAASEFKAQIQESTSEDYDTEFLDMIIAVKVVPDVEGAILHINEHGSKHTDCIVTENKETANYFMTRVDAAGCYWNASTRFADGFRYGFGAEVGVSTNKTHARGPVGLEGLVIYKYKVIGNGNGAGDYGSGKKQYKHETIQPSDYKL
jgi:glutamate-5-semialdehyde dehydrogenase